MDCLAAPRRGFLAVAALILFVVPTSVASAWDRLAVTPDALSIGKAPKLPVGVWSGPGDGWGDYAVLVVRDGPRGAQPAFFAQQRSSTCDGGPVVLSGIADNHFIPGVHDAIDGDFFVVSGDLVCADTGEVGFGFADVVFVSNGIQILSSVWDQEGFHYGPWERRCDGGSATIVGTPGDDVLEGTPGNDVIDGRGGDDVLKGKGGMDILCGRGGRDRLVGGGDIDVLIGGEQKDRLEGGPGWDLLLGEGGRDKLKGGGGGDFMFGDAKKDRLIGGRGQDYADGGPGPDNCNAETRVSCANAPVVMSDDGFVRLELPKRGTDVSIRRLNPDELPSAFDGIPLAGSVYALGSNGAEFDEPVKVTMRIPVMALGGSDAVAPIVLPFLSIGGGGFDGLMEPLVKVGGGEVVVTGTVARWGDYSNLALAPLGNPGVTLSPANRTIEVGSVFSLDVDVEGLTGDTNPGGIFSARVDVLVDGAVDVPGQGRPEQLRCGRDGAGSYGALIEFGLAPAFEGSAAMLNQIFLDYVDHAGFVSVQVSGTALCTPRSGQIGAHTFEYAGPISVPSGGELKGEICVAGRSDVNHYVTAGEPPGSPMATHYQGVLGADGCMFFSLPINWPPGLTSLYTSDGSAVEKVTDIEVEEYAG